MSNWHLPYFLHLSDATHLSYPQVVALIDLWYLHHILSYKWTNGSTGDGWTPNAVGGTVRRLYHKNSCAADRLASLSTEEEFILLERFTYHRHTKIAAILHETKLAPNSASSNRSQHIDTSHFALFYVSKKSNLSRKVKNWLFLQPVIKEILGNVIL